jgi:hypothetical protein
MCVVAAEVRAKTILDTACLADLQACTPHRLVPVPRVHFGYTKVDVRTVPVEHRPLLQISIPPRSLMAQHLLRISEAGSYILPVLCRVIFRRRTKLKIQGRVQLHINFRK